MWKYLVLIIAFVFTGCEPKRPRITSCIYVLRGIDGAKGQFILEHQLTNGTVITKDDLKPYFRYGEVPKCPMGGEFVVGKVGEDPKCTFPAHASYRLYPDAWYTNK